ncbi:TPA: tripartite tricarboxylate transporter substrate-binding protein [Escherichia coli]
MIKHLTLPKKMAAMVLLAGAALSIAPVQAASWPTKQIELVVPYAAGGGTDLVARAFADAAKNHLPVSIGVINKPGGGGAIGLSEIAAARPGGYKIGLGTVELTTLPSLGMVRFKTSDFKPIARLNADPAAITVRADAPWNSYEEFMTYAKANPGKVRIGNSGTGAIWHLAAAALEDKTGAKFSHVPYDGAAPAITGLLGGHIEAVSVSPGEVINHVKGGKLKTLVVMADERMKTMPDVPTLKEKGVDLSIGTWRGLIVSQKTPQDVVDVLAKAAKETAEEPAFQDALQKLNLNYAWLDAASFQTQIMLGALTLQGMQPGPLMFTDHGDMVYTLFVGMIFCYFMLLVLGLLSLKVIGNVVKIPGNILTPMILALCVVGTYALNNSLFDVGIMLIAGVVGYFMQKGGYPASPVVLALIMGPMAESNFRRALSLSGGSLDFLYTRPITLALLTLAAFTLLTPIIRKIMRLRRQ